MLLSETHTPALLADTHIHTHRGAFMQVQQLLQQQFGPEMEVVGSQYPPPVWRQGLAQALGMVQMGALGGVIAGDKLFEAAGVAVPEW